MSEFANFLCYHRTQRSTRSSALRYSILCAEHGPRYDRWTELALDANEGEILTLDVDGRRPAFEIFLQVYGPDARSELVFWDPERQQELR